MPKKKFHYYILLILYFICIGERTMAYEYSVKSAFCNDYARNKTSFSSSNFQYNRQVAYNLCMRNAGALIRKHEIEKEKQRQFELENQKRRQIEYEKEKKRRLQQKIEEDRRRKIYEDRINSLIDNADSLFR